MPLEIEERALSRGGQVSKDAPAHERLYWVRGTDDESAVRTLVSSTVPSTYGGLWFERYTLDPQGDGTLWDVKVSYGKRKPKDNGDSEFSFDTRGGTTKITQSLETVENYAPAGEEAPDFGQLIGVSKDSVEGTDITVPKFAFSITRRVNTASMTIGYLQNIFTLTGRVNNAAWSITIEGIEFNFEAGEVLFLGASGRIVRQDSDDDQETLWELEYGFEASPNATDLSVGDISGIDKDGWDYLWVRWEDAEDEDAAMMVKRPRSAHVERVYFRGDFADLEL